MSAWLVAACLLGWSSVTSAQADDNQARKREVRTIDRIIVTEPLPPVVDEPRLDIAAAPSAMAFHAPKFVASGSGDRTASEASGRPQGLAVWLMLTALIAAGGWLGWSKQAVVAARVKSRLESVPWAHRASRGFADAFASASARMKSAMPSREGRSGQGPSYGADTIEARLARVVETVATVPRTVPLREVLEDELRRVRQRLAAAQSGGDGAASGRLTAPAFRVLLRDLERIERIAISAQRSMGGEGAAVAIAMPASAREAYDVLGINANVTDATLKKILDALRMSWHPDLASDDADRRLREERIKQINIAGELIAAERRPA